MKIIKLWPIFLLAAVYSLSYFNTDYVLIPALTRYGLSKGTIILLVCPFSFLDMLGGYIGWSNFRSLMEDAFRHDINFVAQVKGEQKTRNFLEWLRMRFAIEYMVIMEDGSSDIKVPASRLWILKHKDRIFKFIVVTVKSGSYLTMIVLGLIPVPGARMVPDILCGTARWKKGFAVLAISNTLRITAFVYGWDWLLE